MTRLCTKHPGNVKKKNVAIVSDRWFPFSSGATIERIDFNFGIALGYENNTQGEAVRSRPLPRFDPDDSNLVVLYFTRQYSIAKCITIDFRF